MRRVLIVGVPLLLGLLACVALVMSWSNDEQSAPQPEARQAQSAKARLPSPKFSAARPSHTADDEQLAPTALVAANGQDEHVSEPPHEPHPITDEHLKNYRQVDLLREAWVAIKHGDYTLGRQMVAVHRAEYAGQWEDINKGLEVAADCMQDPSPETLAAARRFYDEHTASTMRRRVRRYCLEQPAAAAHQ